MNNHPSSDMYVISCKNQLIFTLIFLKVPTLCSEIERKLPNSRNKHYIISLEDEVHSEERPYCTHYPLLYTHYSLSNAQIMEHGYRRKFGRHARPAYRRQTQNLVSVNVHILKHIEMFTVYAITSTTKSYIYVGMTNNFERRFAEHNKGYEKTTKPYIPFKLLYKGEYKTRIEARKREKYLKSWQGKDHLKQL